MLHEKPRSLFDLEPPENSILAEPTTPEAKLEEIQAPVTIRQRRRSTHRRENRDLRRVENAADAIAGFDHETSIYGFTKGRFSFISLLEAALDITGPAALSISTWTAAGTDVARVLEFIETANITSARWLVDLTFARRKPQAAARIRSAFGPDSIRVAQNHAKFALIENDDWQVVIETSMNLNHNPRFENFRIQHDPELAAFMRGILDEIWKRQPAGMAGRSLPEITRHFDVDL